MRYLTLDELIAQLRNIREEYACGDAEVVATINCGEYIVHFELAFYSQRTGAVVLDDGTTMYSPYKDI